MSIDFYIKTIFYMCPVGMFVNYFWSKFKIHCSKRLLVIIILLEAKKFVVYRNITLKR